MNKGRLPLPGEDIETEMFAMLMEHMEKHGRKRYEISNFAVPGYESTHNLIYWENATYAGIGAGAHGYLEWSALFQYRPHCKVYGEDGCGRTPSSTDPCRHGN